MTGWLVHNGVGLHWRQDGDPNGPPVLLLNSLGTDLRPWGEVVVPHLNRHRILRVDTRGHGLSDAPDGTYSLADLTDDTMALITHLRLDRLSLVGVSLGGMVAQTLAARMPERLDRLILSNTAERMGTSQMWSDRIAAVRVQGIHSIADAVLERWFARSFRARPESGYLRNMRTRTSVTSYAGCCAARAAADLG